MLNLAIDAGFGNDFLGPRGIKTTRIMDADEKIKCSEVLGAGGVELLGREDAQSLYFNITNHRVIARILFVAKEQLSKLSKNDQKTFVEKLKRYAVKERKYSVEGKDLSVAVLMNRGNQVYVWNEATIQQEKMKFQNTYAAYKKEFSEIVNFIENLPSGTTKSLVKINR
jgi:hypothetical protein